MLFDNLDFVLYAGSWSLTVCAPHRGVDLELSDLARHRDHVDRLHAHERHLGHDARPDLTRRYATAVQLEQTLDRGQYCQN